MKGKIKKFIEENNLDRVEKEYKKIENDILSLSNIDRRELVGIVMCVMNYDVVKIYDGMHEDKGRYFDCIRRDLKKLFNYEKGNS